MNREEIIRMAREAHGAMLESGRGMYLWHGDAYAGDVQDFCERFAVLVAAAEREACAKACDELKPFGPHLYIQKATAQDCAAAIRART